MQVPVGAGVQPLPQPWDKSGNYEKSDPACGEVAFLQAIIFYGVTTSLWILLSCFPLVSLVPLLLACDAPPA